MSDNMDDWKQKMKEIREASEKLLLRVDETMENSQRTFDKVKSHESLLKIPEQNQISQVFMRMVDQQNQFHEDLLNKLDEIIKALKK